MKYFYIFLLYPFFLFPQSEFIPNSHFGIKADIAYSSNNNFSGLGGDIGLSLFGFFDIGIDYMKTSYTPQSDVEAYGTIAYTAYNFRDKNTCIKILVGYSSSLINSQQFLISNLNVTGPLLSLSVSPKIYENESFSLLPSLGFSITFLSVSNRSNNSGYSVQTENKTIAFEFNVVSKVNKKLYFILAPSVSKDLANSDNPLIFGFNLGFLFNVPKQ